MRTCKELWLGCGEGTGGGTLTRPPKPLQTHTRSRLKPLTAGPLISTCRSWGPICAHRPLEHGFCCGAPAWPQWAERYHWWILRHLASGSASNRPQREVTHLRNHAAALQSGIHEILPSTRHARSHVSICQVYNYKSLYSCNLMWQGKERRGRGQRAWEKKNPLLLCDRPGQPRGPSCMNRARLPKVKQGGSSQHGSLLSDLQLQIYLDNHGRCIVRFWSPSTKKKAIFPHIWNELIHRLSLNARKPAPSENVMYKVVDKIIVVANVAVVVTVLFHHFTHFNLCGPFCILDRKPKTFNCEKCIKSIRKCCMECYHFWNLWKFWKASALKDCDSQVSDSYSWHPWRHTVPVCGAASCIPDYSSEG